MTKIFQLKIYDTITWSLPIFTGVTTTTPSTLNSVSQLNLGKLHSDTVGVHEDVVTVQRYRTVRQDTVLD